MHEYSVFDHDRSIIGRWLGVLSISIAGGLARYIAISQNLYGWEEFLKATVTTGGVYFVLHWVFNKWVWKIPYFEIPNLNGIWTLSGKTLSEDGSTKFDWEGEIGIEQNWKQILIHLKTKNSQSKSYNATLSKIKSPIGGWQLTYGYKNDPEINQIHELNSHKGYCEIEFSKDLKVGNASYFNSGGRNTYGTMNLRRNVQ